MINLTWKNNDLKNIMSRKGVTQQELAEHLKISQNTISQYVNAKREPNLDTICKICNYLGIKVIDDLFKKN